MSPKYNQQHDINRLSGCLSGAEQALGPERMLMTLTPYFMQASQESWEQRLGAKPSGNSIQLENEHVLNIMQFIENYSNFCNQ
jgi:hypothetical protein